MRREGEGYSFYRGDTPVACRARGLGPAAVARGLGDRPLSPPQRATGPFFFSRDFVANLKKKKLHFGPVALWGGDRGTFEMFQNKHIFLKF